MLLKNNIRRRGLCFVLSAASGTGKSTLARALLAVEPDTSVSISVTTRPPRPGEQDGRDYHFVDDAAFDAMVADGALLEWAEVYGRRYGTPRAAVESLLDAGRDVIFDIDWQGHRQLRAALPGDVVGVFLMPPAASVLRDRLRGRGTDAPSEIARRLALAAEDLTHWPAFDHVVINDTVEAGVADLRAILRAARLATGRQTGLAAFVGTLAPSL